MIRSAMKSQAKQPTTVPIWLRKASPSALPIAPQIAAAARSRPRTCAASPPWSAKPIPRKRQEERQARAITSPSASATSATPSSIAAIALLNDDRVRDGVESSVGVIVPWRNSPVETIRPMISAISSANDPDRQ